MNVMQDIRIEKVTVNIGCGESGEKLERATKLLNILTGAKVVQTATSRRTTFGTPKGRPIGCKITLRKQAAAELLKRLFDAVEKKLSNRCFDKRGNFSFGIKEHIDIPGVKYDPDIGIYGMDVCVTLERKGFVVSRKSIPSKIGKNHIIKPEEAKDWIKKTFGVVIE